MLPYYVDLREKVKYFIAGTTEPVSYTIADDTLVFDWKQYIQTGIDILIENTANVTADTLILSLDEKTEVYDLRVLDENGDIVALSKEKGGRITVDLGVKRKSLTVRIIPNLIDICIKELKLVCADQTQKFVFPTPSEFEFSGNTIVPLSAMSFGASDDADAYLALGTLIFRSEQEIVTGDDAKVIFEKDETLAKVSYEIKLSADGGYVRASDTLGFMYAVEAVIQLTSDGIIPSVFVKDSPRFPFRGVHLYLPAPYQLDFFKLYITEVVIPMHYNTVIIELSGAMEYKSHPEINEMWETIREKMKTGEWPECPHWHIGEGYVLKEETVRELVLFLKGFGLNVVPEINSLSHVQWLTKAHPEISEEAAAKDTRAAVDLREADANYDTFYPDSYCPSNPKTYEILFDIMQDVIDVFEPTVMHMGHDEVYTYGKCDKCKGRAAEVIAEDIKKLHGFLTERGIKMMLWGDMMNNVNRYAVPELIDMIPKDILLLDFIWYFKLESDTEVRHLDHGFTVAIGNLYSSHFPRYESRMKREGIIGGQMSTWVMVNEKSFGFEGKMYDAMMTGDLLCNENHIHDSRRSYARIINIIQQRLRRKIRQNDIRFTKDSKQHLADRAFEKVYNLPSEIELFDGMTVSNDCKIVKDSLSISLYNKEANKLGFVWATQMPYLREAWKAPKQIGSVNILYEDGSEQSLDIEYGVNIYTATETYGAPLRGKLYRHEGYCGTWNVDSVYEGRLPSGDICTLYLTEYPLENKAVESVTVNVKENGTPIIVYGVITDK